MSATVGTYLLVTSSLGGEIVRLESVNGDGTARQLTLSSDAKDDKIINCADLGTGETKTLWSSASSHMFSPKGWYILVDPENVYDDGLSRSAFTVGYAPVLTIEVSTADAVAGVLVTPATPVNEAVALVIDAYREVPFVLPNCGCRSGITVTSQDKAICKIRARSNQTSGFGTIRVRCLPFQ